MVANTVSGNIDFDEGRALAVAEVMRLAYMRGLVQIKGGNVSFIDRFRELIYITPSGVPKYSLKPSDIAVVTVNGERVKGAPSVEYLMHLNIYKTVEEANAIVHAHPPYTLAAVEAGLKLDLNMLSEALVKIKCYTIVPELKPGSRELALTVARALKESGCNTAVLRRHGVVAYSNQDPFDALDTIESLEDLAKIHLLKQLRLQI
jgi:L-fuculose-phosphate aldolase